MAYRHTIGLPGFPREYAPYEELLFQLLGLDHTLSLFHFDIANTWIHVRGPGAKFWIRGRLIDGRYELTHTRAFNGWDPNSASPSTYEYEVTVLPAGSGIL
jgi:hypothetical protein